MGGALGGLFRNYVCFSQGARLLPLSWSGQLCQLCVAFRFQSLVLYGIDGPSSALVVYCHSSGALLTLRLLAIHLR